MASLCPENAAKGLEPLDPTWVAERLSQFPFVKIDGVHNVRTLGPYAVAGNGTKDQPGTSNGSGFTTKPNFIFRSALLSGITEEGKARLRDLNIRTVFDLRSDTEITKYSAPIPEIEGVEIIRTPVYKTEDYSPEVMSEHLQLYSQGTTEAFMELYSRILNKGGPAFSQILRHIRDRPQDGILFHCTAGKDRTAVIAAILLLIANADDETIVTDYELTRVGREPDRDAIMKRVSQVKLFAENKDAVVNLLSSTRQTMEAFLEMLRDKYGGVENYVQTYCGISADDIRIIRRNMLMTAML